MNTIPDLLFSFQGRISRRPWWFWKVASKCLGFGLLYAAGRLFPEGPAPLIVMLAAMLWVDLALDVKRFHDRGKSGWWVLMAAVPLVGVLWILIDLGALAGTQGENRFGLRNRYGGWM